MKNVTNRNLSEIVNEGIKGIKGLFDGTLEETENLNDIDIDAHIEAAIEWANAGEEIVYKFEEDENIPQNGLIADKEDITLWYSVASYDELKKEVEQEIEYQKKQRFEENEEAEIEVLIYKINCKFPERYNFRYKNCKNIDWNIQKYHISRHISQIENINIKEVAKKLKVEKVETIHGSYYRFNSSQVLELLKIAKDATEKIKIKPEKKCLWLEREENCDGCEGRENKSCPLL
jgi:hypothetical protein